MFVQTTCEDLQLPNQFGALFLVQLKQQIIDFQAHTVVSIDEPTGERLAGRLGSDDENWWGRWRKRLRTGAGFIGVGHGDEDNVELKRKLAPEGGLLNVDMENLDNEDDEAQDVPAKMETSLEHFVVNVDNLPPPVSQGLNHEMRILIKVSAFIFCFM